MITGFAHWDGSGASGDFLAALSFYTANGTLLSRVFPSTPVAQGGVADVSYAPFPGGLGRSSGSGITEITSTGGTVTITDPFGPTTNLESAGGGVDPTHYQTISGSNYVNLPISGAAVNLPLDGISANQSYLDLSTPTTPTWLTGGVYAITASVDQPSIAADPTGGIFQSTMYGISSGGGDSIINTTAATTSYVPEHSHAAIWSVAAGDSFGFTAQQSSGILMKASVEITIVKLS